MGGEKAAKDEVETVMKTPKMEIENVQGNSVKIVGVAEYFIERTLGGERVKTPVLFQGRYGRRHPYHWC